MGAIIAIVMLSSRSLAPVGQFAFLLTRGQQARQTLDSLQRLWDGGDERGWAAARSPRKYAPPASASKASTSLTRVFAELARRHQPGDPARATASR
jgi:hypothetical protein